MNARLLAILTQSRTLASRHFSPHRVLPGATRHFSALLDRFTAQPGVRIDPHTNGGGKLDTEVSPTFSAPLRTARPQSGYVPPQLRSLGASTRTSLSTFEAPDEFEALIQQTAAQYDVNPTLVKAVVRHESNFDPDATSRVGAAGLMQLMPSTARELGVSDVYDPVQNLDGGVRYLKKMLKRYDGNVKLALAAYNAGPGNVDRYGGVPPFGETQRYVTKVLSALEHA